jgi:uncharacterized protein (DUF697 family)
MSRKHKHVDRVTPLQFNTLLPAPSRWRVLAGRSYAALRGIADSIPGRDTATSFGGLGPLLAAFDWERVRADVVRDSGARIELGGLPASGKSQLLTWLSRDTGAERTPADACGGEDFGLFAVRDDRRQDVTADGYDAHDAPSALVIWLIDATIGPQRGDFEVLGQLRAATQPVLVALNKCDLVLAAPDAARMSRILSTRVIPISALRGHGVMNGLLPAIAEACPRLLIALGREVPAFRARAVRELTRRAALLSGVSGIEPVPLLDLPFQALIQLQLVLQIAAAHGVPVADKYSRELVTTLVGGVGLRFAGQQLSKTIPYVGWAASGALAVGATLALGRAADAYFRNGRQLPTRRAARTLFARNSPTEKPNASACEDEEEGGGDARN